MRKKCYESPSVSIMDLLDISVLTISNDDVMDTGKEYEGDPWW